MPSLVYGLRLHLADARSATSRLRRFGDEVRRTGNHSDVAATLAGRQAASTVYPRGCGGTSPTLNEGGQAEGLSPRVRGNHRQILVFSGSRGSIPAGAGEPV